VHLYVHGDFVFRHGQIRLAIPGHDCSRRDGYLCPILDVEGVLGQTLHQTNVEFGRIAKPRVRRYSGESDGYPRLTD
jgi:hypothetical protein